MSQHVMEDEENKWVFGWDQPLMSFFLQKHQKDIADPDDNPVVWLGATQATRMYEVEDLVRMARRHGLHIPSATRVALYGDKDDGK